MAGVAAPGAPAPLAEGVGGAGGGAGGDEVLGDQGAPVTRVMDVRLWGEVWYCRCLTTCYL